MKQLSFFIIFIGLMALMVSAQKDEKKSLEYFLKKASHDTSGVKFLQNASNEISFFNPDSGLILAKKALDLARDIHFKKGEADALNTYGEAFHFLGDYPSALK